jgi:TP901 family phage tail tape measure protein
MAGKFTISAIIKGVDRFSAPIAKMQSTFSRFTRSLGGGLREANRLVDRAGAGLARIGVAATAAGAAIGLIGKNVIDTGADFEEAISAVGAVSLMTKDQIEPLRRKALELGASTKFSATEVANGMELMGKAGFDNTDILKGISGVLSAAAADGAELADTAGHISNVLKGMGMETTEATRVADVLALASARTNSSISSLGESMANVSSTARQFKIPLEDTIASVALLQDVGLDASEAGSAVNTMLTKLAAPTDAIRNKMKEMGVTFQDANGNMLPLGEVMAQLAKSAEKSGGNMEQVAFFAELVGLRGQKAAANLKDMFLSGKAASLTNELKGAAGSAERMAKLRLDNFKGDMEELGGAIDSVKIALFDTQSGPLRGVVQSMTKWVDANRELITQKVEETIQKISDAMPAILDFLERAGRAVVPILAVAAAVKGWALAQFLLNAAMAANPWTLLIIGVTAAAALIAAFWPEIKAAAAAAWQWIKDKASAAWEGIKAVWESAKRFFLAAFEFIAGLVTIVLWPQIQLFKLAAPLLMAAWEPIKAFFGALWDAIASAFGFAWEKIKAFASAAYDAVVAVWQPIAAFFSGLWDSVAGAFKRVLGGIIDKVVAVVDKIRGLGRDTLGDIFGDAPGEDKPGAPAPGERQVVSPDERTAERLGKVMREESTTKHEVTITDPKGRAKFKDPKKAAAAGLRVSPSGAF